MCARACATCAQQASRCSTRPCCSTASTTRLGDSGGASAQSLFDAGVLPYYLHLLDQVQGAAHFDVDEHRARRLRSELTACLPGYLVPRLVREIEGAPAKTAMVALH